MPYTTGELIREFSRRAKVAGLTVDVPSDGSTQSKMAIVSDYPGVTEKEKKIPLVGSAGRFLWDALRPQGITRQQCYVTNVIKKQVSLSTETERKAPLPKGETEQWEGLLDWELAQLPNLEVVLCIGGYALHALTGEHGITQWRGSCVEHKLIDGRRVKVVIANNPALALRDPKQEPIFKFDMYKLKRVLTGEFNHVDPMALINPSLGDAIQFIDSLQDSPDLPISFDIESIGGETACYGLANSIEVGMCINLRDRSRNIFSIADERRLLKRLDQLFSDERLKFVAQNGNFDTYWTWFKDRVRPRIWFDTLLAHHTLYPQLPHSLGFLTAQYTDHPYYKDEGTEWRERPGETIDTFWQYNVKDACYTLEISKLLHKELRNQSMEEFFFSHVMRVQPHLAHMTVGGILVDVDAQRDVANNLYLDLLGKEQAFINACRRATGDETLTVNPRSPKQLGDLYFRKLKLVGRGTSTDDENRDRMLKHPRTSESAKEVLRAHNVYAEDQKFYSTYATVALDEDGRIRCEWKQFGTQKAPGRLSSAAVLWGTGTNLQNQPEDAKRMFIADEGCEFSYFDLSQAEARVVAVKANCEGLREVFRRNATEGLDVHRLSASRIFKVPYDDIPMKDWDEHNKPTLRYKGKRCVHGLNYRMMPEKLAAVTKLPISEAISAHSAYHRVFPEIREWWDATTKEFMRTRTLFNALGRRLFIMQRIDDEALESIVAFYPQSTIGDKINQCIYQCHEDREWPRLRNGKLLARVALNVHDALVTLNRIEVGEQVRHVMAKHAQAPFAVAGEELSIPCELGVSEPDEFGIRRWSTIRKIKLVK